VELAVRPDARKRPAIDETFLPQATQTPERHVLVGADKADELRGRGEAVTQDRVDDVESRSVMSPGVGVSGLTNLQSLPLTVSLLKD